MKKSSSFSEYIIFADESGDHGMTSINPENPVFALVFCIFKKADYCSIVKQAITKLKLEFWGHDLAILHSHEIRRSKGEFAFLFNEEIRRIFLNALHETIQNLPFFIVATVIDKRVHKNNTNPENPYLVALQFCLEYAYRFLDNGKQLENLTHIIVESRGKVEDQDLELAFRKISDRARFLGEQYPFDIKFANKKTNSTGLQIADLVAHPIAKHVISKKPNKAFDVVKEKLFGYPEYENIGLILHPLENEMPQHELRQTADRELPIHL